MPVSYYTSIANNIALSAFEERYHEFFVYKRKIPGENDVLFTRNNKGEYKYCYFGNTPVLNTYGFNQPPYLHKADSYTLIKLLEYPTMCEALPKIFIRDLLIFLANNP